MQPPAFRFTSELWRISQFLYAPENIHHPAIDYRSDSELEAWFEDRATGSYLHLKFPRPGARRASHISYWLDDEENMIARWIVIFRQEFAAKIAPM